jgi:hypothetical protein
MKCPLCNKSLYTNNTYEVAKFSCPITVSYNDNVYSHYRIMKGESNLICALIGRMFFLFDKGKIEYGDDDYATKHSKHGDINDYYDLLAKYKKLAPFI